VWSFRSITSFSEKHAVTSAPEDGDTMFLRNIGIDLQIHGAKTQDFINIIIIAVRSLNIMY
jgi:hypothetical protein